MEFAVRDGRDRDRWKTTCGICLWRCARKLSLGKSRGKNLICGNGCIDCAVGHSRRDGRAAHGAKQSSLKRLVVGRVGADQVGHAARQDIAENPKAGPEHGFWLELPRNRRSWLQNGQRCRRKQIAEMSLNGLIQRLIDIMRDGTERAAKTGDLIMRIQRIGVEGVAQTERPGQFASHFPGVLRVDIEIEKVEGLICVRRERLRRGVRYSVDELLQIRVGHRGNRAFSEVVVVQAEDTGIGSEPQFMSAMTPGEVVVDEKAGCAPALNPGVVEPSHGREGIRAGAL